MDLPRRIRTYQEELTDSTRWDHFVHRPGDIFIATRPKNGTTWMQSIVCMVLFESAELDFVPQAYSPWFDASFKPVAEVNSLLEQMQGRRVIKTHTPLDGIPYFEDATYITVWRDPRDAFVSMRHHYENMKLEVGQAHMEQDLDLAFRQFVTAEANTKGIDALANYIAFFNTFWTFRHLPNVHLFHYANLKANLIEGVRQIAEILHKPLQDELIVEIAEATQFDAMKARADKFVAGSTDFWKKPEEFLKAGKHGQWRGVYSDATLDAFDARMAELVAPNIADWLVHGGNLPS